MLHTFLNIDLCVCCCTLSCGGRLYGEAWFFSLLPCPFSVIDALDMESMVNTVKGWQENPVKFARSHGISLSPEAGEADVEEKGIHILIVEGFLIYNYK